MDNLDDGKEYDVGLGDGESSTHPREQSDTAQSNWLSMSSKMQLVISCTYTPNKLLYVKGLAKGSSSQPVCVDSVEGGLSVQVGQVKSGGFLPLNTQQQLEATG